MSQELTIRNEITIEASPEQVWDVLTNPKTTPQYMYGCEVLCDWQIGSPILWKGVQDGIVYVKGNLVEFRPHSAFAFTVFDPHGNYPDIPQNHLKARYTLKEEAGATLLAVTQGDYSQVAEGSKRYEDTMAQGGWGSVLEAIQKIAQEHIAR